MSDNPKAALRDLVDAYADAVNRRDGASWQDLWAPEGVWELMGQTSTGAGVARARWEQTLAAFPWALHLVHSGITREEAGVWCGRWYVSELLKAGSAVTSVMGCYRDTYVEIDGAWRFARRRFDLLYQGPPDLTGMTLSPNLEELP